MAFFEKGDRDQCPHCQTVVLFMDFHSFESSYDNRKIGYISLVQCPNCHNIIVSYRDYEMIDPRNNRIIFEEVIYPLVSGRSPVPSEVPDNIAKDYNEACLVLPFSPKASAALARRCLQTILVDYANAKSNNLSQQIDEVLSSLPTQIAENLDYVRQVGNFAAHEQKSTQTGLILDVEPNEAEWTLDVLESLFDFYFVVPAKAKEKRETFNSKLDEVGKPPLKEP